MRTKAVIVYSPTQARRRTFVVPDDDSQVPVHAQNVAPGEAALVVSLALCQLIGPDAVLARYTGRVAQEDRCVLADAAGNVVGVVRADPAIDGPHFRDGHTLCADPLGKAKVGDYLHRVL